MHNWRLYSIKTATVALRRPNGGPQTSSETLSAAGGHCLRGVPRASHNEGLDPGLTRTGGGRSTPSRALTKLIIEIRVSLRGSEVIARPVYPPEPAPSWGQSPRRAPRRGDSECRTPTRWKRMSIKWVIIRRTKFTSIICRWNILKAQKFVTSRLFRLLVS